MRGYKVFNSDFTCRGFQFKEGEIFEVPLPIQICNSGFHFCVKASHCFSYYSFDSNNIVCEVEALGEIETHGDDSKVCTNKIKIIRKLTWYEVLQVSNEGKNNTGHSNTGDSNTGDWNTGYSNTGDRNTGAFCTGESKIKLFNKESNWTHEQFINSKVYRLLCDVNTKMWIYPGSMTEDEKEKFYSYKTCDGYLKDIPFKEAFQNQWNNWNESNRNEFKNLPNFDSKIFEEITGVKI